MRGFEKESGVIPGQVVPDGGVRAGDLSALLARVEAAEGPDRDLDAELCAHFRVLSPNAEKERWAREWAGPVIARDGRVWLAHADGRTGLRCESRPLTASLDAALSLHQRVLPGWTVASISEQDDKSWFVELREGYLTSYGRVAMSDTRPKTPALALLAAMLEALGARAASPCEGPSLATDEPK